jgi:hypothetical protein
MSRRKDPKYRHHKARNLAVVRTEGKDHYLGRYGSEESKAEYHRLLADWRAGLLRVGRDRPSTVNDGRPREDAAITVLELANRYWEFARHLDQFRPVAIGCGQPEIRAGIVGPTSEDRHPNACNDAEQHKIPGAIM